MQPHSGSSTGGSAVIGLMSFLVLAMAVILPAIGGQFFGASATEGHTENRILTPAMQRLEMQRTALTLVDGGSYFRGSSLDEIGSALNDCPECDPQQAESAAPAHLVQVSSFWMETSEVSNAQYAAFLNTLGSGAHKVACGGQLCVETTAETPTSALTQSSGIYTTSNPALDNYPVTGVSWYGAQAYCQALGRRLPTEAEWEFAARGGDGTLYPWGNEWRPDAANVRGSHSNADGVIIAGPEPVGGYGAFSSRDGIRDLAGNVAEWTADWYAPLHYLSAEASQPNDSGPQTGSDRVVRGGSWDDPAFYARSVNRTAQPPASTSPYIGFRCVASS